MYYPQEPKEPGGCVQSIVITRMIIGMLAIPIGLILGAVFAVLFALWALSLHPLLGLAVIVGGILLLFAVARWESDRLRRNAPKDE
jgi:uncharacterized membrane protein